MEEELAMKYDLSIDLIQSLKYQYERKGLEPDWDSIRTTCEGIKYELAKALYRSIKETAGYSHENLGILGGMQG